jgi:hypothetical protein
MRIIRKRSAIPPVSHAFFEGNMNMGKFFLNWSKPQRSRVPLR